MGKTLYLHVGTHKTATTALQGFCARNARRLEARVLYPATGRAAMGAHHLFFNSIRTPQHPGFPPRKTFDAYVQELRRETRAARRVLMSSEILSETIDMSALEKLKEVAGRIVIILYLRPQHAYIVSLYNELVKNTRWSRTLSESTEKVKVDYLRICRRWSCAFGKENLVVRPFQASQFAGGSVFADFLGIFGLPLTGDYVLPDRDANPSLSRDAIEFKRALNLLPLSDAHLRKVRDRLMNGESAPGTRGGGPDGWLDAAQRAAIMKKYEQGNACVAAEFLGREDGRLFSDDLAGPEGPREAYGGLSARRMREMAAVLREGDPELFGAVREALAGVEEPDPAGAEAVQALRAAFL